MVMAPRNERMVKKDHESGRSKGDAGDGGDQTTARTFWSDVARPLIWGVMIQDYEQRNAAAALQILMDQLLGVETKTIIGAQVRDAFGHIEMAEQRYQ
jgi:hypothetical protein